MNRSSDVRPVFPAEGEDARARIDWPHSVQFYETDDFLCDSVADFVSDGLVAGEPVVVLTTEDHREGLRERVRERGMSWDSARRKGRLVWMDARQALELVMVGGEPDAGRFDEHVAGLVRTSRKGSGDVRVRAYGELVDLLWRDGLDQAALRVEEMWNDLARTQAFSLLCAYFRGNMYTEKRARPYRAVCRHHTRVLPPQKRATPAAPPGTSGL